jgi:hypothetical protein
MSQGKVASSEKRRRRSRGGRGRKKATTAIATTATAAATSGKKRRRSRGGRGRKKTAVVVVAKKRRQLPPTPQKTPAATAGRRRRQLPALPQKSKTRRRLPRLPLEVRLGATADAILKMSRSEKTDKAEKIAMAACGFDVKDAFATQDNLIKELRAWLKETTGKMRTPPSPEALFVDPEDTSRGIAVEVKRFCGRGRGRCWRYKIEEHLLNAIRKVNPDIVAFGKHAGGVVVDELVVIVAIPRSVPLQRFQEIANYVANWAHKHANLSFTLATKTTRLANHLFDA